MQVLARDRLLGSYKVLNPGIFILESNYFIIPEQVTVQN